jgi:cell division protein FtsW
MSGSASPYKYLFRQIIILGSGIFIGIFFLILNLRTSSKFASFCNWLLLISLWLLFVFGKVSNHARSWFDLGPFNIQPSEFFKVFSIIWLAKYYDDKNKDFNKWGIVLLPLVICFFGMLAIFMQPDLGTTIIYLLIVAVIFLLSPISSKIKYKLVGIGAGLVVIGALVLFAAGKTILSERQMSRITSVISPTSPCSEENYYTTGNQVCNGYIAINNGGMNGLGLGNSIQKYLYLPEAHTDFIFCIIIEELGLRTGILILLLYLVLLFRIVLIGKRSLNNRDALICYGAAFYIFVHIMVNLCGVFGLLPMTGVPLPFMSYGGSYAWCLIIILTIVQRINIETKMLSLKEVGK